MRFIANFGVGAKFSSIFWLDCVVVLRNNLF